MMDDFLCSMSCVINEEELDFTHIVEEYRRKTYHIALMPAIHWYSGIYNLFDQKADLAEKNMIWIIPAAQADFFWLPRLRRSVENFYENDEIEIEIEDCSKFYGIEAEEFEECILLHSDDLQNDSNHMILGANVILVRLSLSSGRETILLILLDHQDVCWRKIIERYHISLTWFVDSGRGTGDYFVRINLYQLMKQTIYPDILPEFYFKGLYNKGEIPEHFQFLYAMLSQPNESGYDKWHSFSGVYKADWKVGK